MFIIDTDSQYIVASRQDPTVPAGLNYERLQGDSGMIYMDSGEGGSPFPISRRK